MFYIGGAEENYIIKAYFMYRSAVHCKKKSVKFSSFTEKPVVRKLTEK